MNRTLLALTNATTSDLTYRTLMGINAGVRVYGLVIQIVFLVILVASRKLHNREHVFINHATCTNGFVVVLLFVDMFIDVSPGAGPTLCSAFDLLWSFATYIRMYSIVLIALYRYFGVFVIIAYKRINQSVKYFVGPIAVVWLLSVVVPVVFKFSINTKNIYDECDADLPSSLTSIVLYFCLDYLLQILLPTVLIVRIYVKIMRKLEKNHKKLVKISMPKSTSLFFLVLHKLSLSASQQPDGQHDDEPQQTEEQRDEPAEQEQAPREAAAEPDQRHVTGHHHHHQHRHDELKQLGLNAFSVYKNKRNFMNYHHSLRDLNTRSVLRHNSGKKQRRFTLQLILMCVSVSVSSVCLSVFSMRYVIADYVSSFRYWDPVLQIVMMLAISMVPVIAIYYHPARNKILKRFHVRVSDKASMSSTNSGSQTKAQTRQSQPRRLQFGADPSRPS